MDKIILITVLNEPGVLNKITGLCRRRRYNINSLTVSTTELKNISHITMIFDESPDKIDQIMAQIKKIIEVIKIEVVDDENSFNRELIILELSDKKEIIKLTNFKNKNLKISLLDKAKNILEITGDAKTINNLLESVISIKKMVRSGLIALKK